MPTLVYVHGRGQKGTREREHEKWFVALREGLGRLSPQSIPTIDADDLQLAYWSDLFYPPQTGGARGRSRSRGAASTGGLTGDEAKLMDLVARQYLEAQLPLRAAVAPELPGTALTPPPSTRVARRGGAVAPAAEAQAGEALAQYEDTFMRDVVKYFGLGFADKVSPPLFKLLSELPFDDGLMLVSHSFGTIVCYDVLVRGFDRIARARQDANLRPLQIDTWVTMGCPLGWALDTQEKMPLWLQVAIVQAGELKHRAEQAIESVQKRLEELRQRLLPGRRARAAGPIVQLGTKQFPPRGVERWYNIYDLHDWISYPPVVGTFNIGAVTVGDTFLWNNHQRAFDISIVNDFRTPGFQVLDAEAHNDRGYGQCAQLAQLVNDFWQRWEGPGAVSAAGGGPATGSGSSPSRRTRTARTRR